MEISFQLCRPKLTIPIKTGIMENCLEIFDGPTKVFEFMVPVGFENAKSAEQFDYDYIAGISAPDLEGHTLTVKGDFAEGFFELMAEQPEEFVPEERRPEIHFTADYGWINDPNGLLFDGEQYHLYFQHNPCNIKWNNMSWGHAVSRDLMHWNSCPGVMYPDAEGTMFSGCGLIQNGLYYFPYTVAGTSTPWNKGKPFYQGLAISNDRGMTLKKQKEPFLGITGKDSRDPKIFWHEESSSFIMVLYLEDNDFGIFRSPDLKDWEMTQRFTVEKAWECPDLLCVPSQDRKSYRWMFWCADGFYYWGDFDGYQFTSDWKENHAYIGGHLYAAQTFWGIKDRILSISWIRLEQRNGNCYQGAMTIPKEYEYTEQNGKRTLLQKHAREFMNSLGPCSQIPEEGPYLIEIPMDGRKDTIELEVNGSSVSIDPVQRVLAVDEEFSEIPVEYEKIEIVADYNVMEINFSNAIIGTYKIAGTKNSFKAGRRLNGNFKGRSSQKWSDCNYSIKSLK